MKTLLSSVAALALSAVAVSASTVILTANSVGRYSYDAGTGQFSFSKTDAIANILEDLDETRNYTMNFSFSVDPNGISNPRVDFIDSVSFTMNLADAINITPATASSGAFQFGTYLSGMYADLTMPSVGTYEASLSDVTASVSLSSYLLAGLPGPLAAPTGGYYAEVELLAMAPVPLPAAMPLLGLAGVGLVAVGRRRKKTNA